LKQECSFLKKRTKKLFIPLRTLPARRAPTIKSFLRLFSKKKTFLPFFLCRLEPDILGPLPQGELSQWRDVFQPGNDRAEMIAGELAHFAGEVHAAIGDQQLRLANAAWIQQDLPRRRIAGVILVRYPEIEVAERHPDRLAAPAHMYALAEEGQAFDERRACFRRGRFQRHIKRIGTCNKPQLCHVPPHHVTNYSRFVSEEKK